MRNVDKMAKKSMRWAPRGYYVGSYWRYIKHLSNKVARQKMKREISWD